ncbi:ACT domain-containing protein [Arenimonas sp.]|uniref:ACT domain-containing protein n=1 Tax=Arenimonas sp. TaxID=1872635 RepID=UPI0039E5D710
MIRDLGQLLAQMEPVLNPGAYAFVLAPVEVQVPADRIVASVREPEGLTLVIPESLAQALGLPVAYACAWITLTVHSDLEAVGLTAAFSGALGEAGISCNVIAGVHHDHLFVPIAQARQAMDALARLQASAR